MSARIAPIATRSEPAKIASNCTRRLCNARTACAPLSTVRQNWQEGGVLLARKVLGIIRGEPVESQMLPTALVLRST